MSKKRSKARRIYTEISESADLDGSTPIEGAELSRSDPFSYGKKKNWQGAKDGAYFTKNIPAGEDRPKTTEILLGKIIDAKKKRPRHNRSSTPIKSVKLAKPNGLFGRVFKVKEVPRYQSRNPVLKSLSVKRIKNDK